MRARDYLHTTTHAPEFIQINRHLSLTFNFRDKKYFVETFEYNTEKGRYERKSFGPFYGSMMARIYMWNHFLRADKIPDGYEDQVGFAWSKEVNN